MDMADGSAATEFLADAMDRVRLDRGLSGRADAAIEAEARLEPLIAQALRTPQTPPHHAEGPFLNDHLRLALQALYAVSVGDLRLRDIEELARLKGYEGEVEDVERSLRENVPLYETFVLCHDAAKWPTVYFDAPAGSPGHAAGFAEDRSSHRRDDGLAERVAARARFLGHYAAFVADHPGRSARETQRLFYESYRVEAHYAGHDRAVHAPAYRALLRRVAGRRGLSTADADALETLVAHHLDPVADFVSRPNAAAAPRYRSLAARHGLGADAFVVSLRGCVFLDTVCGSEPHDAAALTNFLRAEHDAVPGLRAERERVREERRKRARNAVFRAAGLDGAALMDVLGMKPGPAFGAALRDIQEAVETGAPLPTFGKRIDAEIGKRIGDARGKFLSSNL
jgi:hypothetical protein